MRPQAGMINSIGLQNIGVRAFVREKLPALRSAGTAVFANIFGYAVDDYVEVARRAGRRRRRAGYELNVSCPNTKHGGIFFSSDPRAAGGSGAAPCATRRETAADREAFAECRADRAAGAGGRERRRGCDFAGEHVCGSGDRCGNAAPPHWSGIRGAFRARPSSRSRCGWFTKRRGR